jgi:hypothetical protein
LLSINASADEPRNPGIKELEEERKHLETLFADRINFYLVFAAGILIFVFAEKPPEPGFLKIALVVIVMVSGLMLVALFRTFLLVRDVLNDIVKDHRDAPYTQYCKRLKGQWWSCWLPNANDFLFALPIAMTAFFVIALIHALTTKVR